MLVTLVAAIFVIGLMTASLAGFVADFSGYADELQPYWDWMKTRWPGLRHAFNDC